MNDFVVTFLGTNGSNAYNGGNRVKYGTNTSCVVVSVGGETLIFDAGSGISGMVSLPEYQRTQLRLFFSHYHTDHLGGLLFFPGLFDADKRIDIYGSNDVFDDDVEKVVRKFLSPPFAPVGLEMARASLSFNPLTGADVMELGSGIRLKTMSLSHPGGALGFRIEYMDKVFCHLSDVELGNHQDGDGLLGFIGGADLVSIDSAFDEGKVLKGWGHSSYAECADLAKRADVGRLALFHYGFNQSDAGIDKIADKAKLIFPSTFAAADGMRIEL